MTIDLATRKMLLPQTVTRKTGKFQAAFIIKNDSITDRVIGLQYYFILRYNNL